jgi:hypothetical protein
MRFAGMRMEGFLNPNKPDMGNIAQSGMANRSAVGNAATMTESQVASAGIGAAGKVEAANLLGAATQSQADASTFASGMGMIGQIAGAGIGAIPTGGSFGGGGTGKLLEDPTAKFRELNPGTPVYDWTT